MREKMVLRFFKTFERFACGTSVGGRKEGLGGSWENQNKYMHFYY